MGECFFWYWPTGVVPDQRAVKRLCVCVSVLVCYRWRRRITEHQHGDPECDPRIKGRLLGRRTQVLYDGPRKPSHHRRAVCRTRYSRCLAAIAFKLFYTATPDTTKLSRLCCVRFGAVNWIPDDSRLSPTENLRSEHVHVNCPIHTPTPDTSQTGLFCRVWCSGVY